MKKRGRKSILKTPSPIASPTESSPKSPIFTRPASTSKGVKRVAAALTTTTSPPRTTHKAPNNISDLKSLASSSIDELKRRIDRSHSEILKDLEASHSRLHKRFKVSSRAFSQIE
jgi:hypothetical protein